jgi:hypothetical protein
MDLLTISKEELICAIASLPMDAQLVVGADYGDRASTIQAIALELTPTKAYAVESAYSNSGYKLVSESRAKEDLGDDVEGAAVYVLNGSSVEDLDVEDEEY